MNNQRDTDESRLGFRIVSIRFYRKKDEKEFAMDNENDIEFENT